MEDYPSLAEGNGLENRQVGQTTREFESLILLIIAGWSSLVARRAHNPKVAGSNPAPAIWSVGLVGLGRLPVTQEITSSSLVRTVLVSLPLGRLFCLIKYSCCQKGTDFRPSKPVPFLVSLL